MGVGNEFIEFHPTVELLGVEGRFDAEAVDQFNASAIMAVDGLTTVLDTYGIEIPANITHGREQLEHSRRHLPKLMFQTYDDTMFQLRYNLADAVKVMTQEQLRQEAAAMGDN